MDLCLHPELLNQTPRVFDSSALRAIKSGSLNLKWLMVLQLNKQEARLLSLNYFNNMKKVFILFLTLSSFTISAEEVLSEFVYYELTRADTK